MSPQKTTRLILAGGFSLMIALTIILGIGAIRVSTNLVELTTDLYRHPLTVSNNVLEANIHIMLIHRLMKDLTLEVVPPIRTP